MALNVERSNATFGDGGSPGSYRGGIQRSQSDSRRKENQQGKRKAYLQKFASQLTPTCVSGQLLNNVNLRFTDLNLKFTFLLWEIAELGE